jgi:hypothetical protein
MYPAKKIRPIYKMRTGFLDGVLLETLVQFEEECDGEPEYGAHKDTGQQKIDEFTC